MAIAKKKKKKPAIFYNWSELNYSPLMNFTIIAAMDSAGGIGFQGKIPWKLPRIDVSSFMFHTTPT